MTIEEVDQDPREELRKYLISEVENYVDGFDLVDLVDQVWDRDRGEINRDEARRLFCEFIKEWRS